MSTNTPWDLSSNGRVQNGVSSDAGQGGILEEEVTS
jgi:hypothetical protein